MNGSKQQQNPEQYLDKLSSYKLFSLMNISRQINGLMEINKLLELIMDSCKTLLNCEGSSLMLVNKERRVLTFNVITGTGQQLKEMEVPLGKGIAGIVAETGQTEIINNAQEDPRVFKAADEVTSMVTRNIICVPLEIGGDIIGVLEAINSLDGQEFTNDDLLLMLALAEQAAISINNRRLYDQERARVRELSGLFEISQLTVTHDTPEQLLQRSIKIVTEVLNCKYCSILMPDGTDNGLTNAVSTGIAGTVPAAASPTTEELIAGEVFSKKEERYSSNISQDKRYSTDTTFAYTRRSFMAVPLQTKERDIGVLYIADRQDEFKFTKLDLRLIKIFANQISEVYENLRLYEEEKIKVKMEKELEVTRRLQEAIFPKRFPELPGVSMFATNLSASEVGGDFYDLYRSPDNPDKFSAIIADVSGKSVPAALFMAISRSVIRAQTMSDTDALPADILEKSNELIIADSESAMFVTAFFLQFNLTTRELLFSNGGHNNPLLLRKDAQKPEWLHTRGKPLGIIPGEVYQDQRVQINPGDLLILYTDGIVEANNASHAEYGTARLEQVVIENRRLAPHSLTDKIIESVKEFAGGAPQFDDMTLFIFQFS